MTLPPSVFAPGHHQWFICDHSRLQGATWVVIQLLVTSCLYRPTGTWPTLHGHNDNEWGSHPWQSASGRTLVSTQTSDTKQRLEFLVQQLTRHYCYGCREYLSTTWVVNYSSNFLLLEYSLISISGCKFPNCSFNHSENAPIHLLFSNLACGLLLDRRESL